MAGLRYGARFAVPAGTLSAARAALRGLARALRRLCAVSWGTHERSVQRRKRADSRGLELWEWRGEASRSARRIRRSVWMPTAKRTCAQVRYRGTEDGTPPGRRTLHPIRREDSGGIGSKDLLRASIVLKVAHGERFLLTRRYLSDGRIMESSQAGPTDMAREREVGRFDDLRKARRSLLDSGWVLSEEPHWLSPAGHFVALVSSLTALGVLWVAPSIAVVVGSLAGLLELGALMASPVSWPMRLARSAVLLGAVATLWYAASPFVRAASLLVLATITWTAVGRRTSVPR